MSHSEYPGFVMVAAIAVAVVLASCSVLDSSDAGEVIGESEPPVLILKNKTGQTAHYFAIEEDTAAHITLILDDYREWPKIGPGESKEVPFDEIKFYDEGDRSVYVWWQTGSKGGSFSEPPR